MKTKMILPGRTSSLLRLNRLLQTSDYQGARYFILLDENSYNCCLAELISTVSALQEAEFIELPVGEDAKCVEIAQQVWESLLESGAGRNDVIINLGGGCVSDAGGFIAAAYQRGMRVINIPTTLLSMIDASIGGKTAMNLQGVKNQVGFFHQPEAVCFHLPFLATLPVKEWVNGSFELLKTLMLSDVEGYHRLLEGMSAMDTAKDMVAEDYVRLVEGLVSQAVMFKDSVARQDPYDKGLRQMLNLGHTFGHAIEAYSSEHGTYSHGEAVGLGMVCALYLSVKKLGFAEEEYQKFRQCVAHHVAMPHYGLRDTEALLGKMRHDKKNEQEQVLGVLMQEVSVPVIRVALDDNEIRDSLLRI